MSPFAAIPDLLRKRAELGPERLAMRELLTGNQVTYAQLDLRAARSAGLLASVGVEPGDRVALLCRNRIEFFELLFACAKLGAILVPLNWRMPAVEIQPLLDDCAAEVLLFGKEDAGVAADLSTAHRLNLDSAADDGYAAMRERSEPAYRPFWPETECWYLLYTSGTTGKPKAVIQTYRMAMANYVNISQGMGLRGDDTTVNFLPLFHTGGINLVTLPALLDGATVLVLPGFDVDQIATLLVDGAVDSFFGVPACYQALSLHPRFGEMDLSRVRTWGCGGAPLPDNLIKAFLTRGARVCNGMGMTETGPTVFLMDADNVQDKIGSVGKPQLLSSVRLAGPDGNEVSTGASGELWFSGPGITPGYWQREEETRRALVDGTWLRSGDLGRKDEDGYYYIVGRLKDMYISGGENVYPAEVENELAQHPDILEAAVIGIADEKWGEVGEAWILPRPDHDLPDDATLRQWCRERMAAYKVPRAFKTVREFPRTAAGKIQKHLLTQEHQI